MALRIVLAMVVLTFVMVSCNGDGGDANRLPTVESSVGPTFGVPIVCEAYCGEGGALTFRAGLSVPLACEHSICLVDGKCLYGCPPELVFPLCNVR